MRRRDIRATGEVVVRSAVRALLVTPDRRVLLVHYLTPDTGEDFWCTPGGACEAGEDDALALRRECREELGLDVTGIDPGPVVATRRHDFVIGDGRTFQQSERFYLLRVAEFVPRPEDLGEFEAEAVTGFRWWALDELRVTPEEISPSGLDALVLTLLDDAGAVLPLRAGV